MNKLLDLLSKQHVTGIIVVVPVDTRCQCSGGTSPCQGTPSPCQGPCQGTPAPC